jgi:putative peptidoglycan lipid II flippase
VHATLAAYAVGLLAASSVKLFASGFHAQLDTRTPVRYAVLSMVVGAVLAGTLMWPLYTPGLALGAALGSWFNLSLLWRGLRRRLGSLLGPEDLYYVFRVLLACLAGAGAGLLLVSAAPAPAHAASLGVRAWATAGTLIAFGVVFLAVARLLRALPPGGLRVWKDRA